MSYQLTSGPGSVTVADATLTAKDGINYIGSGYRDPANPWGKVLNQNFLTLSEEIKAIPVQVDYGTQISTLQSSVGTLQTTVGAHTTSITSHETRVTAVESEITAIQTALTSLVTALGA